MEAKRFNLKNIAIITARGGSKRIPSKNIKMFCGKPIIAYSIEAAIESACFDTVMVSTDSIEIANISKEFGAEVPFYRTRKTADDFSTTVDVLNEVIKTYEGIGKNYEYACCIYPTAPFLTGEKVREAMELLKASNADSAVPVVEYEFPPQRAFVLENGYLEYKWPENMNTRSQDLEVFYHDCGQFYAFRVEPFLQSNKLITSRTVPILLKKIEAQDIDDIDDWKLAEMKYSFMMKK